MYTDEALDALFSAHLATLVGRTAAALEATGTPALVIGAGLPRYRYLDDQPYPFTTNPHFRAWVPAGDAPGSLLVIRPGARPLLAFHQPEDYWHQPPAAPAGPWTAGFEIVVIRAPTEARRHVPAGAAFVGERFDGIDDWGFGTLNPGPLLDRLHWGRATKTPYELGCMRRASAAGARAHRAAVDAFESGGSEYEIHLAYLAASGHTEAELPYPSIIALNEGGAILHYTDARRSRPAERRSMLIDAGAQFRGYACDITRTHAAGAGPFRDLVAGMDALERRLCARVRPGTRYPDIHLEAHRLIGELLAGERIIRCSAEAAVATGLTSVFFPHGVGHLLGLQVHDIGGHQTGPDGGTTPPPPAHPFLRLTRTLEPGTVVTIEPGLYFIDLLLAQARADGRGRDIHWERVAELAPCGGVRIEDDVVATAAGPENLTRDAFAALAA
jgi:Xaa-Pro dipeptidase